MKNIILMAVILSAGFGLTGCISTNVKGYSDADYKHYRMKKVMVQVRGASLEFAELLEKTMVKELKDEKVDAAIYTQMFSPTREWSNDQVKAKLQQQGFDELMSINLVSANSGSQHHGYINNSSASLYGNTAYANTTMTPIVSVHRNTGTSIKLFEVASGKVIWLGETSTQAGGLLYMSDSTTTESIVEDVVESLKKSGHL